jgi:hypothetical protein
VEPRHVHSPVKDQLGQEICSVCHMVIIHPIFDVDDPRLQPDITYYRLPEVLVTLYYEGPEYGFPKAPVAPFVRDVAAFEGDVNRYNPEELWNKLADKVA